MCILQFFYFVKLFKNLLFITQVRQNSIMYYYLFKMQCTNSWVYGQKGVSRINVIPLKIFCKRFNKERNTQVNEKEKKKKIKYE